MRKKVALFVLAFSGIFALAASAQPLQPGEAVATCFSENDPNGFVVGFIGDIRNPGAAGATVNQNWAAPMRHHPTWTRSILKEVFGIALDNAPNPNVYLTSTSLYRSTAFAQTVPGTSQVFKIDGTTLVAAPCGSPIDPLNTAAGLGNIDFDEDHQQLFVTSLQDGRIYRLDTACQVKDTYDPFAPFNPAQNTPGGFAPLGERLWGVGKNENENRLYFSRWSSDTQAGPANSIWSVALDSTGKPVGAPLLELTLTGERMPVADIEFSADGSRMLLAQRGVNSQPQAVLTVPHQSHLLEFTGSSGSWAPSTNLFKVGQAQLGLDNSSSGGTDYVCPATPEGAEGVVATGDALRFPNPAIYGLQVFPSTGGTTANSFLIDLDGNLSVVDKTEIGDVDVYNTCGRQCSELTGIKVLCTTDGSGNFIVQFQVKNLSSAPVYHAFLVGLPAGVTASPDHFSLGAGLAPGQVSQVFQTTIHGAQPGQQLTFQVTLHDQDLAECCATRHTITLPECDCAQVLGDRGPTCRLSRPFGYNYSFTLQNLFPQTPGYVLIAPDTPATATFSPGVIAYTGSPQTVSLSIGNVTPGQQVCFLVSLHTKDFERCCSIRRCVTLPRCFDVIHDPVVFDTTQIFFTSGGLKLEDSARKPGVRLPLAAGTVAFDLAWRPEDSAALPVGGTLEQTVKGVVGDGGEQIVARLGTTRTADGAELRASFPGLGATTHRFEFYRNGEQVGVQTGLPGDAQAICNCGPKITTDAHFSVMRWPGTSASQENAEPCDGTGPDCVFAGFTFPEAGIFHLAGRDVRFLADEVRVVPENGTGTVRSLTAAEVRANGLASLTLTDFQTDQDCNGNRIPDYAEITRGGGLDLDRDGVLDACEAPAALSVSLATGFNQGTGAALPPRAADDDWKLAAPGAERPAVVIAQPHRAWQAPLPGSRWIGAEPGRGTSSRGVSNYTYERCFCLAAGARDVTLDLRLKADDRARVLLNGQALSGSGGGFRGEPLAVRKTGAAGDGLFVAGKNCVGVEVQDTGGVVTGFTLDGLVTAPAGACR